MEFALKPMASETMFEGEGGAYYTWSSSKYPLLGKANVGAGQLLLQPNGFALPHYSDSSKVGFVLQGTDGVVGIVLPNTTKEVVLKLRKGDLIPVPSGAVSWWFNNGESEFIVLFIGETSEAHIPGQFTYFLLTGTQGVLRGFSSEVLSKAYNLNKDETNKLTKSQNGALIIKLQNCQTMPSPQMDKTKELVYNIEEPENYVKNGGFVRIITEKSFPFIGQVGLSFVRVKLEPNAIKAPVYEATGGAELICIAKGSGKVEVVGMNGKPEMDTQVKEGDLLVVPQYFVISEIAGDQGMECISILKTPEPVLEELAGKGSIWEAISPVVQEVAFNADPKFVKLFLSKISNSSNIIIAPTN